VEEQPAATAKLVVDFLKKVSMRGRHHLQLAAIIGLTVFIVAPSIAERDINA
jgi:hypothetical protein